MKGRLCPLLLIVCLTLSSCVKEQFSEETSPLSEITFGATYDESRCKTVLDGTATLWKSDDAISVFDGTGTNRIFSDITVSEDGRYATFSGMASLSDSYLAISPSQSDATVSSGKIRASIPSRQTAVKDSFGPKDALAIARTSGSAFQFCNTCALLSVTIHNDNIASVSLSSGSDNSFAGVFDIDWNDGDPLLEQVSGNADVTLSGTFEKGGTYYFAVAPGKYSSLKLTFTSTEGNVAEFNNTQMSLDLSRGDIVRIADFEIPAAKWSDGSVYVGSPRVTSSSVCIAWTCNPGMKDFLSATWPYKTDGYDWSTDLKKTYKVGVYSNAACTNVIVEHTLDENEIAKLFNGTGLAPRYTVTGLDPNRSYYYKVFNLTDNKKSSATKFTTKADSWTGTVVEVGAGIGDVVFYDNFDRLIWNGDPSVFSAGYRLSNDDFKSITTVAEGKATGTEPYSLSVSPYNVPGNDVQASTCGLFYKNQTRNVLDDLGYTSYVYTAESSANTTSSVDNYAGCIKIGDASKPAEKFSFYTNVLGALPSGASVKVSFKACKFCSPLSCPDDGTISVSAISGGKISSYRLTGYSLVSSQDITVSGNGPQWAEYSAQLSGLSPECRVGFSPKTLESFLIDDVKIEITGFSGSVIGKVIDSETSLGIAGVKVTDGYSFAVTDENGEYSLPETSSAKFIYLTVPAEYEMPYDSDGYPLYYKTYSNNLTFSLAPLPGGKQDVWNLLVGTDWHYSMGYADPIAEAMSLLKNKVTALNPEALYGVNLGDLTGNNPDYVWDYMKKAYAYDKSSVHFLMVMGNHDWNRSQTEILPHTDTPFTNRFGPTRWSFDRGDVHIVGMNNTIPTEGTLKAYNGGFLKDEYEWLKKDLAATDKDKMVILCVHVPFRAGNSSSVHGTDYYHDETIELLSEFSSAMIFGGHNHRSIHYNHTAKNGKVIHETTFVSGPIVHYYSFKLCEDGSPAGVTIFKFKGAKIVNQEAHTFYGDDYAMRVYDASECPDGEYMKPYGWQQEKGWIVANVFTIPYTESGWKVGLYQNGSKCCNMQLVGSSDKKTFNHKVLTYWDPNFTMVESDGTCANNYDWWYLHQEIEPGTQKVWRDGSTFPGGFGTSPGLSTSSHLYMGQLDTVPSGQISDGDFEVRVSDPYGNVYKCSTITHFSTIGSSMVYKND